jgi:hypothetical protein
VSGVNVRPGPTFTAWTPEVEEEGEADIVVDELSSPYWGEARADVASTPKTRAVEESMECMVVIVVWNVGSGEATVVQSPGSKYFAGREDGGILVLV